MQLQDADDAPLADEPKKDEPKKDEPKPDAPKQEEKAAAPAATGPAGTWNCSTKEGEKVVTFTLVVTLGDAGAVTAKFTSDQRNGDLAGQWDAEAKKLTLSAKNPAAIRPSFLHGPMESAATLARYSGVMAATSSLKVLVGL